MAVYAYVRTSKEEQSATPDEQARAIRQRFGDDAEVMFEEFPGRHIHRPLLDDLLARLLPGDVVAVQRTDRLARGQDVGEPILRMIWQQGATADSVESSGVLADTPDAYMQRAVLWGMAGAETKRSAQRQQDGKRSKARAGTALPWGNLPYGLRLDPDIRKQDYDRGLRRYVETPQAEIVRRIFTEWNSGKGITAIAADLNVDGIPSPRAGGKWKGGTVSGRWSKQSLYPILSNPAYIGVADQGRTRHIPKVSGDGALLPGGRRIGRSEDDDGRAIGYLSAEVMPTHIIDDDTFALAQEELSRRTGTRRARVSKAGHPFSGLAKCMSCGSTLHWRNRGNTAERWGRLMCPAGWGRDATCTAPTRVDEQTLALAVVREAVEMAMSGPTVTVTGDDPKVQQARRTLEQIGGKLARAKELFVDGEFGRAEYDEMKEKLEAEKVEAEYIVKVAPHPPVAVAKVWELATDPDPDALTISGDHETVVIPDNESLRGWLRATIEFVAVEGNTRRGGEPFFMVSWRKSPFAERISPSILEAAARIAASPIRPPDPRTIR